MKRKISNHHRQKTIGVLIDWTVDSYHQMLLSGVMDFARDHEISCIVFEGGSLCAPFDFETQRNQIYQLASAESVDGLVILSASIAHFISPGEIKTFCEKYRPLPMVSISMDIANLASVLVDNQSGMRELLVHLIDHHGFRRFAYIHGPSCNQDAKDRLDTFYAALQEYHVPVDSQNIFQGDFTIHSGVEAAKYFSDRGIMNIDAIVAGNDNMAIGAMEELDRRGIHVPKQISVTGFDNIDFSCYSSPALTTVKFPIYDQGYMAAKLLVDILEKKDSPKKVFVPTKLIIRDSCNCNSRLAHRSKTDSADFPASPLPMDQGVERETPDHRRISANHLMQNTMVDTEEIIRDPRQPNISNTGLREQIPSCRLSGAEDSSTAVDDMDYCTFRNMLVDLWLNRVSSSLERGESAIAEDGEFQAIMDLGQCAILKEWRKINELLQERQKLELIRELLVTMDISSQMDIITRRLPVLGIKSGYLSLYKDNPLRKNEESTCLLGFQGNQRILIGTEGISFPSRKLVPDDFLSNHGQRMIIVEALKNFGFIVFEMGAKPTGYFALLSDIISGTLEGALLFKELENQKNDLSVNLEHMRKAMAGFIQTMSATVEMRDPYTAGHQRRVSDLARTIAQEMALAPAQIEGIRMAGILHDLGKIYIPAEILNRAGVLDDIERSMIKRHPKVAFDILNNIEFPWPIANIVYQHHERMNGKGYPRGIKGASIIMEARILAVADVVEAMSSHRPYRESLGIKKALEEINKNTGVLYDPQVVDICTKLFREKGYKFKSEYLIPAVK